jgi:sulfoxide reductase heme-binding subunit YedZ
MAPLAEILVRARAGALTADPIAEVMNELGLAALVLLFMSLACTPARHLLGWTWPIRIRRDLGLLAFLYAVLHFMVYLLLDQGVDLGAIVADIVKRPFITVGFVALVLLVPVAITSPKSSVRQLGFARWKRIHQLVYVSGVLAAIHFIWRVKIDVTQPLVYAAVLAVLFAVRVIWWARRRSQG